MTELHNANADWLRAMQRTRILGGDDTDTLFTIVARHAQRAPDAVALRGESGDLTYAALVARAQGFARWSQDKSLAPGDIVALVMHNHPDYVALWLGMTSVGLVVALVNPQLAGAGLAHCLDVSKARHVIADATAASNVVAWAAATGATVLLHGHDDGVRERIDVEGRGSATPAPPVRFGALALLIYTSGTTGLPKAARVSHRRVRLWSEWFAGIMDATPDDRLYDCLPMYHSIGGVVAVGSMLAAGGSVIVRRSFSASQFWPDVRASGATIFQYIGELCRYLLNAPPADDETEHRLRLVCGNGLRQDVWEPFVARFAINRVIEYYAATEANFSLFNLPGKPGAIGHVPPFMAALSNVALIDVDAQTLAPSRDPDGFCVRSPRGTAGEAIGRIADSSAAFEGYTDPAQSERKILRDVFAKGDLWFRTGDLMRRDAEGYFFFVDRLGDTFRWKGENVSTLEVGTVLQTLHGVREAIVYGVAIPGHDGRAGMASLVVDPSFNLAVFRDMLAERLPRFARPVFLRLRQELRSTGTFKPLKAEDARDGFDPDGIADPLYVDDLAAGAYVAVDADTHARILSGALRL